MKCRRCWAEKAYLREVKGWKGVLLACLWLVPMKCHHCYHRFVAFWPLTIGKQITPPPLRIVPFRQNHGPPGTARRGEATPVHARKRAA